MTAATHPADNQPIRVLQLMDKFAVRGSPIHGVSRLMLSWWPSFAQNNIEPHLAVFRASEGGGDKFTEQGIEFTDLNRSKFDVRSISDIISLIREKNIDVLHCHGYGATTFGRIAGLLSGTPVIVQEHMIDSEMPIYQSAIDWLLSAFTAKGIAVSNAVNDFMIHGRHISAKKMVVVYNGIPADNIRSYSPEQIQQFFYNYELRPDVPVVGMVGRLDPIKGHREFLQAACQIAECIPSVQFVIVGDGAMRDELEDLSHSLDLQDCVHFLGHQEKVLELVALFDVFVSCSHSEGLPMALAEAMAMQKPVIATAVGGVPEIVVDGQTGILVPARETKPLVDAITQLLEHPDQAKSMGVEGLKRCEAMFLASNGVKQLADIYRQI